jgi:hypothetical protein
VFHHGALYVIYVVRDENVRAIQAGFGSERREATSSRVREKYAINLENLRTRLGAQGKAGCGEKSGQNWRASRQQSRNP